MQIYTVKRGDTLYEIAKHYHISLNLLAEVNGIQDKDSLSVGEALLIPKVKIAHTVSQGETLYSIARQYGITLSRLFRNNPSLAEHTTLTVGNILVISYEEESSKKLAVNGYAYPHLEQQLLTETLPTLSYLSPFSYGFTGQGDLVTLSDERLLSDSKNQGVSSVMVLSTLNSDGKFDNSLSRRLFRDEEMQDRLTQSIIANMMLKGYRALEIDFQFLFEDDRELYSAFLKKLKIALSPYRYALWVAISPKTSRQDTGILSVGHDYRMIGEIADRILLKTYEWGYRFNGMSVSPLPELTKIVDYAITEITPEKILLGIPNYGYDYLLPYHSEDSKLSVIDNVTARVLARQKKAEIQFDEKTKSPYFRYFENGKEHLVTFEDARSMAAKLTLIDSKKLGGLSFWTIMQDFPQGYFSLMPYQIE